MLKRAQLRRYGALGRTLTPAEPESEASARYATVLGSAAAVWSVG